MYFPTIHSLPTAPRLGPQIDAEESFANIPELILDSDSEPNLPTWQAPGGHLPRPRGAIKPRDILFGAPRRRKNTDKKVRFAEEVTTYTYEADDEEEDYYEPDPLEQFLEPVGRNERYPRPQNQSQSQVWDPTGWTNLGIPVPLDFYSGIVRFGSKYSRGGRVRSFTATNAGTPRLARKKTNYALSNTPPVIPPRSSSLSPHFLLKPLAKSYQTILPSISTFLSASPLHLSSSFSTDIQPVNPQRPRPREMQKVYRSMNVANMDEREWERRRAETALDFATRREPRLEDYGNYSHYGGKATKGRRPMMP